MRKLYTFFVLCTVVCLVLCSLFIVNVTPSQARVGGNAYDLIAAVNDYRANNGLSAYETNAILMGIAQNQSDYLASTSGAAGHIGPDGSEETQRAIAAGYGGGATVVCDENWAASAQGNLDRVISQLWQDSVHLSIMLSTRYVEVGAGATDVAGLVYYVMDVCYIGAPGSGSSASGSYQASTPGPTSPPIIGLITSTPNPDGSVVHIVQSGQTLIGIADAYGVALQDLLTLNNRTATDPLYVGDRITIKLGDTPTPTSNVTETSTPRPPTATRRPTRTATPVTPTRTPTVIASPLPSATSIPPTGGLTDPVGKLLFGGIILLAVAGIGLMVAGTIMKRKE